MRKRVWILAAATALVAQESRLDPAELIRQADEIRRSEYAARRHRAEALYKQALPLLEESSPRKARVAFELGGLAAARGELTESYSWLEQARVAYRLAADHSGEAATLNQLGALLLTLGRVEDARRNFAAARTAWDRLGNARGVAQTQANEALALRHAGEPQQALEANRRAVELSRAARDSVGEAIALHNTAEVLVDIGDFDEALKVAGAALLLHRKVGPVGGEIHTLIHLAEAWFGKGDLAKAREYLDAATARARQSGERLMEAYILKESARVHASMAQSSEAAARYAQALALLPAEGFPRMEAEIRLRLGQAIHALGRPDQPAEEWTRALALSREVGNSLLEAEALMSLAGLDRDAGRLAQAAERSAAATTLIEGERGKLTSAAQRATYVAVRRELYAVQAGILIRLGRTADAFEISERAHARALLDLVSSPEDGVTAGVQASPGRSDELARNLDAATLVLEYLLGEQESFVFALDRGSLRSFRLPPRARIEEAVRGVREAMAAPGLRGLARFAQASIECHRLLIGPVEGLLRRGKTRLIVVPDGLLHALPFEALVAHAAPVFAELPYLVKTHTVSYAPSLSVLAGLGTGPAPAWGAATGVVALARRVAAPGLAPLPYAEPEAHAIAAQFPKGRVLLLTGERAHESAFQRPEVRLARRIHIATHGLLQAQPGKSGLALGSAIPGEDGYLEADEVGRLRLAAELVVLSGCDTGLGRRLAGEGMLGLTRAFHIAGVATVVSSLWKVADRSTASLMTAFYRRLDASPAHALREAKLGMLRQPEWAHPYYWSAFVSSGR